MRADRSIAKRRHSASRLFGRPGNRARASASVSIMRAGSSGGQVQARELGVEEAEIERRVVGDQHAVAEERDQLVGDLGEARLVHQVARG